MRLNSLVIEPRVRSGWSAIDLGFVLARRLWLRSFCLYLILMLPVFALCQVLKIESAWLVVLILWWLKPIFERPILYLYSRELFSEPAPLLTVLVNIREWLLPAFWWVITIRRFSLFRGMYAPVSMLERPAVSDYYRRVGVLSANFSSEAMWLNVLLFHFEQFLFLSGLLLIEMLVPSAVTFFEDSNNAYWFGVGAEQQGSIWIEVLFYLVVAALAPFYVAAGFMLYISRRIELEGWDIEICFREWMLDFTLPASQVVQADAMSAGQNLNQGQ